VAAITGTTIIGIIIAWSLNMTASTNDNSSLPFIADRVISHDNLADLERVACEAEVDPTITFEAADLVTRTTSELWCLSGMLTARGMSEHARAVAKIAAERRRASEEYIQELRDRQS
jgi:hypothetical protein